MWNKTFWKAVVERALKTFAQAAGALLLAAGTGLLDTDWVGVASASGMAALLSVLTSIATAAMTDGTPSLGSVEEIAPTEVEPDIDSDEDYQVAEDDSELE